MVHRTRFEDFARISADWFWETDADDRFSYFSAGVTRGGLALDSRLGRRRRDATAQKPENLARITTLEAVVARRECFRDFVYQAGLDTEHPYWCSISGEPRHDSAGTFLGYRGAGRDVTRRIEAQRTFEMQSQILQALLRATPDGVQMFDKFNTTLAVNEQTYEILGIPNCAPNPSVESTFRSLLELAKRGEYGEGGSRGTGARAPQWCTRAGCAGTQCKLTAAAQDRPLDRGKAARTRRRLCLLKTPKSRESIEFLAPQSYRHRHAHASVRPGFAALVPGS